MTKALIAGLASGSLIALAAPAWAAQAPQGDGTAASADGDAPAEEIIVTAQRCSERVTTVPISITVASQAQLERPQPRNQPGTGTEHRRRRIDPRRGDAHLSAGASPSVGIFVDQVSQGNANISDLFDVARIEVLKDLPGRIYAAGDATPVGIPCRGYGVEVAGRL